MTSSVVLPFRGVSAADRVLARRADLLEAGYDEVGANGVAKLTMTAVCERAGLTQRYFYEHFRSRDDLLAALFDNVFDEFFERMHAAVEAEALDLLRRARATMTVFVDFFGSDPRKARMFGEAIGSEAVAARKAASVRRLAEYAALQANTIHGPFDKREQTRVMLAALIIVGGQADVSAQWVTGNIDLPREEFIDEVAQLFVVAVDAARNVGPRET